MRTPAHASDADPDRGLRNERSRQLWRHRASWWSSSAKSAAPCLASARALGPPAAIRTGVCAGPSTSRSRSMLWPTWARYSGRVATGGLATRRHGSLRGGPNQAPSAASGRCALRIPSRGLCREHRRSDSDQQGTFDPGVTDLWRRNHLAMPRSAQVDDIRHPAACRAELVALPNAPCGRSWSCGWPFVRSRRYLVSESNSPRTRWSDEHD